MRPLGTVPSDNFCELLESEKFCNLIFFKFASDYTELTCIVRLSFSYFVLPWHKVELLPITILVRNDSLSSKYNTKFIILFYGKLIQDSLQLVFAILVSCFLTPASKYFICIVMMGITRLMLAMIRS